MIKVNLIPVKRKKKAKPIPMFLIMMVFVTLASIFIMGLFYYHVSVNLAEKRKIYSDNKKRLAELKEKIKAVENFEQLNRTYQQRNKIIEQLSKNKSVPVQLLNEISKLLPIGIWLDNMTVKGMTIKISGYGFTNTDIVSFVNNIKGSQIFTDAYLAESKSTNLENVPVYNFKLTFRIKT